jgi:hypothetical protein
MGTGEACVRLSQREIHPFSWIERAFLPSFEPDGWRTPYRAFVDLPDPVPCHAVLFGQRVKRHASFTAGNNGTDTLSKFSNAPMSVVRLGLLGTRSVWRRTAGGVGKDHPDGCLWIPWRAASAFTVLVPFLSSLMMAALRAAISRDSAACRARYARERGEKDASC